MPTAGLGGVEAPVVSAGAGAAGAALEVAAESLPPLLWAILVISRKPTITTKTPSTAIWATGLSFSALLTRCAPPRATAARPQRMKAPTCRRRSA